MKKITLLLIFLYSLAGYCQFPEGFESSAIGLPPNWNQYQNSVGLGKTWGISSLSDPTKPPYVCQGVNSAFIDKDATINNGETSEDYLITPLFTVPNNGQLRFFSRQGTLGDQETTYIVKISVDPDKTNLSKYVLVNDWSEIDMNPVYNACQEQVVDISAYKGQKVYLAFVRTCTKTSTNGSGDSWWIDNINVVSKCLDPSAGVTSKVSATTATLNWTDNVGSLWDIELVTKGTTPTGVPTYTGKTKPYNLVGLQPNSAYQYYIRTSCSASNSNWVGPFDFQTLPFGSGCDAALSIPSLPFQTTSDTANFSNSFNGPQSSSTLCGATPPNTNYFAGNDVFYTYTATKNEKISIRMTPTATNSSLFIYGVCPITGACLAGAANVTANQRVINNFAVTIGTTYTIVISSSSATPKVGYTLVIQEENCAAPVANVPAAANITTKTADLSWTNPTGATEWRVAIQPVGSQVPTIEGDVVTTNPYTAKGLTPSTQYQYYVRSVCPTGDFSSWSGPYLFNTLVCDDVAGNKCAYTFKMTDAASNGWDGATMQVRQNGIVVGTIGSNFTGGASLDTSIPLCKDTPFDLYWDNAGTKPAECAVSVVNAFGQKVFSKAAGKSSSGTTIYGETAVNCNTARCDIAPDTLTATSISEHSATLNWNAPSTTAWDVYIVPAGSPAPTPSTTPTNPGVTTNPTLAVGSLLADTSYTFYVRVVCSPSPSEWSTGYTFKTSVTCPKPYGLTVPTAEITTTQANLYWNKGVNTDNKWEILLVKATAPDYGVPPVPSINPSLNAGDILMPINSPSVSPYLMTGLAPATIYYYYIRTVCSGSDKSVWSDPARFNTVTCDSGKCTYTLKLTDTGNNGWDGARMQIRQNGIVVGEIGSSMLDQTVDICNDIPFDLYWSNAGIKPQEVGVKMINPFGDPIYTKLAGDKAPLTILFDSKGNCTAPTCPRPSALTVQNLTSNTADLGWTETGGATQWEVYLVPTGSTPPKNDDPISNGSLPYYITTKNPLTVEGLNPSTAYDFYVRAICSGSKTSTWTLLTFKTFITKPKNDECDAAIVVPVNPGIDCALIAANNTTKGATMAQPSTNACSGFSDDDVWFSFQATAVTHTISLQNITGTSTDLDHTVYSDGDCGTLQQLYCSNPNISIATNLTIGKTYKIRVYTDAYGSDQTATFDVCITTPPQITNDECSSATDLTVNPSLVSTASTPGSVAGATASLPNSTCVGNANDDVWYKFVATSNTHYVLLEKVKGSSTDLNHAVYSGNCNSLTLKYCSVANSLQSNDKTLVVGQTYYVRVWSNATDAQNINFTIAIGSLTPPITTSITQYTKKQLIENVLLGTPCISVSNISSSTGTDYSDVNGIGYFNKSLSAFPFKEGIILSTGSVVKAPGANLSEQNEGGITWPGDTQLEGVVYAATGTTTPKSYNASKLEFDFIAITNKISFNYLFASEEYGTYQCGLADAFGFFLTNNETNVTTNLAVVPNTNTPVSVITIRDQKYKRGCDLGYGSDSENADYFGQYYGPNGLDPLGAPINFNGLTVPMKAEGDVIPGKSYHIKLVVIDNQAGIQDSAVFIEGGSFTIGTVDLGADMLQSNKTALCLGDIHTLHSGLDAGLYDITWSKDGDVIPNQTGVDLQISASGTYAIKAQYKYSTCEADDSVVIEYYPDTVPGTPTDLLQCGDLGISNFDLTQNSLTILSPYSDNHTVTYYTSLDGANNETNSISTPSAFQNTSSPQTIYARVDNTDSKCHQVVTFKITAQILPPLYTLSGKMAICPSEQTTITVVPTNNDFDPAVVTYKWFFNGSPVIGAYGSSLDLKGSTAYGPYSVTVNRNGCTATQTFDITNSNSNWDVTFTNEPYLLCPGQSMVLSFSANNFDINNPNAVYTWTAPDGSKTISKTLNVNQAGTYNVEIDILGCKSTKSTVVSENTNPIVIAIQAGCSGNDFKLEASPVNGSFDPATATYEWTAVGGTFKTTDQKNTITLTSAGPYNVKVTTADGCSSDQSITVSDITCTIPKGISPDGDGKNDNLDLTALKVKRLEIFNRYGSDVYSLDNYTNQWHGQTNGGAELPEGTYFYQIHVGDNKISSGWVFINRKQ